MNCRAPTPVLTTAIHALADRTIRRCGNKGSVSVAGPRSDWWLSITDQPIRPVSDFDAFIESWHRFLAAHTIQQMKVTAAASLRGEPPWSSYPQTAIRPKPQREVPQQF